VDTFHTLGALRSRRPNCTCERSGFVVCSETIDGLRDYEAEDVLVVKELHQLRALADDLRARIVLLIRERAASITELADTLSMPKGTVGHHVKVLENAGLVRVVRTRKVRALTEKYYGRTARLFVLRSDEALPEELAGGALSAQMLRQTADELLAARPAKDQSALLHVRLSPKDAYRFQRRLNKLTADFRDAETADGELHALAFALFRTGTIAANRRSNGA
jgi:DNA-binding transcriptional ArsR family regulator